jgi:hypothetical protein
MVRKAQYGTLYRMSWNQLGRRTDALEWELEKIQDRLATKKLAAGEKTALVKRAQLVKAELKKNRVAERRKK